MSDIVLRVEKLSKQYPSTGSGQAASAALRQAQDRPAGALQNDQRIADRGGAGTLPPPILRRPWSVVRRRQRDDLGIEGRLL